MYVFFNTGKLQFSKTHKPSFKALVLDRHNAPHGALTTSFIFVPLTSYPAVLSFDSSRRWYTLMLQYNALKGMQGIKLTRKLPLVISSSTDASNFVNKLSWL